MAWNVSPALAAELGDDGPWVWYLKDAWHACATDAREIHRPRKPAIGAPDWHARFIAYWTPMFHPLLFGLGWTRPDLGLLRWRSMGYPSLDPVLNAAMRWWGKQGIEALLAWAAITEVFVKQAEVFGGHVGLNVEQDRLADTSEWEVLRNERAWKEAWHGEGDPFHLWQHALLPLGLEEATDYAAHLGRLAAPPAAYKFEEPPARRLLVTDTYASWYRSLTEGWSDAFDGQTSIDIVCKPVGWLDTYRRSPNTNLWHRGHHDLHLMGN